MYISCCANYMTLRNARCNDKDIYRLRSVLIISTSTLLAKAHDSLSYRLCLV